MSLADDIKAVRDQLNAVKDNEAEDQQVLRALARILNACEEMEKALEYYGSDEAWGAGELVWKRPPIYRDAGQLALECLERVRSGKKEKK